MYNKQTPLYRQADPSLRERAQRLQRLVSLEEATKMTPEEVQALIQELQIYQIELEMQNHQLQQATAELQQAQTKYQDLYDTSPFGYLTLDGNGIVTDANLSAAKLLSIQRLNLHHRRFSQFVHPDSLSDFYALFNRLKATTTLQRTQLRLIPLPSKVLDAEDKLLFAQVEAISLKEEDTFKCRLVFLDITDHKKADDALKSNEHLLSGIINSSTNGIQVFKAVRDSHGLIEDFKWILLNRTAEEFLDTTTAQAQHTTLLQVFPEIIISGHFQKYVEVVGTGEPCRFSVCHTRSGVKHWLNCVAVKMEDGFVLTYEDVTQQHLAHEQLKENQQLLKAIAEALPDVLYVEDLETGRNVYNNRNFLPVLGYTQHDYTGHPRDFLNSVFHPDDFENINTRNQRFTHVPDGVVLETQARVKDKQGNWRTIFFRDTVFKRDEEGKPLQLVGIAQDITEILRSQQELRNKNNTINAILENMPIIIWRLDKDGRITESVGPGLKHLGYNDHDLEGRLLSEVNPSFVPNIQTILKGGSDIFIGEVELKGKKVYKQNYFLHDRETGGSIGFCLDITEQKTAEAEANWRSFILEQLIQKLPLVLAILDKNGNYVELRGNGLRRLGIEDNYLTGRNLFDFFPKLKDKLPEIVQGDAIKFMEEVVYKDKHAFFQNFGIFDPAREYGIAFAIDLTDLKEAEDKLMTEKDFSENLLENSIDGIMAFDKQLTVTAWNKTMEKITSKPRESVLSHSVLNLFPEQAHHQLQQSIDRLFQGERFTLQSIPYFKSERSYEVSLIPLYNPEKEVTGALCIVHDNTLLQQRQEAETQDRLARQKEIMNAVLSTQEEERKRIAESLHNSLAQLLYAAKLNIEDLTGSLNQQDQQEVSQRISAFLDEAIKETRTLAHELIPTSLKEFGLKTSLKGLASRLTKENFSVQCIVTGFDVCKDETLETAIFRIVQELLNNIMKHAAATEALVQVVDKGPVIMIRVEDNGKGMANSSDLMQNSTGMGLPSIHKRVKYMQGTMHIDSSPESGTVITIQVHH